MYSTFFNVFTSSANSLVFVLSSSKALFNLLISSKSFKNTLTVLRFEVTKFGRGKLRVGSRLRLIFVLDLRFDPLPLPADRRLDLLPFELLRVGDFGDDAGLFERSRLDEFVVGCLSDLRSNGFEEIVLVDNGCDSGVFNDGNDGSGTGNAEYEYVDDVMFCFEMGAISGGGDGDERFVKGVGFNGKLSTGSKS
jgi:hypothetical protein